jgi:hypothetical protein
MNKGQPQDSIPSAKGMLSTNISNSSRVWFFIRGSKIMQLKGRFQLWPSTTRVRQEQTKAPRAALRWVQLDQHPEYQALRFRSRPPSSHATFCFSLKNAQAILKRVPRTPTWDKTPVMYQRVAVQSFYRCQSLPWAPNRTSPSSHHVRE